MSGLLRALQQLIEGILVPSEPQTNHPAPPVVPPTQSRFASSSGHLSYDQQRALDLHNSGNFSQSAEATVLTWFPERRKVARACRVPRLELTWDHQLAAEAEEWAKHLAKSGQLYHSSGDYGENLSWTSPSGRGSLVRATEAWLAEKSDYHGEAVNKGKSFQKVGHYTAVMSFSPVMSVRLTGIIDHLAGDDESWYCDSYIRSTQCCHRRCALSSTWKHSRS